MQRVYKTQMKKSQKVSVHYQQARFLLSAAKLTQLPSDDGIEVAFIGRSNAGKSSVLNRLTQIKDLARVSKTPGRTQLINLFVLDEKRRLVDLPGYGFAQVPLETKERWQKTLSAYLSERNSLKALVLVMDIRHPLRDFDQQMIAWCDQSQIPVHILLNKSDKLAHGKMKQTLLEVKKALDVYSTPITIQLFSALKGTGVDELRQFMDQYFC